MSPAFALYLVRPWRELSLGAGRRWDAWVAGLAIAGIAVGAGFDGQSLGLGAAVQLTVLGAVLALAFARLV